MKNVLFAFAILVFAAAAYGEDKIFPYAVPESLLGFCESKIKTLETISHEDIKTDEDFGKLWQKLQASYRIVCIKKADARGWYTYYARQRGNGWDAIRLATTLDDVDVSVDDDGAVNCSYSFWALGRIALWREVSIPRKK